LQKYNDGIIKFTTANKAKIVIIHYLPANQLPVTTDI